MATLPPPKGAPDLSTLSPEELHTGACVLSPDVVSRLGSVLEQHRPTLARDLGFSVTDPVDQELRRWCRNPGSTVFVLASVLDRVGRQDCLQWIRLDMEQHMMRLHLAIESNPTSGEVPVMPKFQQVCTNCDFQLGHSLENVLGHELGCYEIVGPGNWVTWKTPAYKLRGQQLTIRYRSEASPSTLQDRVLVEGDSTKVKQLYCSDESTELKGNLNQTDTTLDSGVTFVKRLFETGSSVMSGRSCPKQPEHSEISQTGELGASETEVKPVGGYDEAQGKRIAKDKTFPKEMEKYETYVKEVYMDERTLYPEEVSMSLLRSHSNNVSSSDLAIQREVEIGLSDSVVAHAPGTYDNVNFETLDDQYLTHCSNATCKLPISRENMHREVSDTKNLPDKDMTKHHPHCGNSDLNNVRKLHEESRKQIPLHATSHPASQGLANVPNLSLLGSCPSVLEQPLDEQSLAELSVEANMSLGERKQNNLNCISVSTAASLFRRNPLDSPGHYAKSMAERSHIDSRDMSPEGENSISNNQGIESGPLMEMSDISRWVYTDTAKRTCYEAPIKRGDEDEEVMMDTSQTLGLTGESARLPSPDASKLYAVMAPPLKRQKSELDEMHLSDNPVSQAMAIASGVNNNDSLRHLHIEDQQQQSLSISQDPNLGLLPPKSNPFRYTPPPPYLVKLPQFQPQLYNSVSQGTPPQTHINDSPLKSPSSHHSSSSQTFTHSSTHNSGSDKIFYNNFQGPAAHHSAPAQVPHTQGFIFSDHYVEMTRRGSALQTSQTTNMNTAFPPTNPFCSSGSQNPAPHHAQGPTGISGSSIHQGHHLVGSHGVSRGAVSGQGVPPRHDTQELSAAANSLEQPFYPASHVVHGSSKSMRQEFRVENPHSSPAGVDELEHYNYINPDHVNLGHGQSVTRPLSLPNRLRVSLQDELLELPGWCPDVNGDNVQETMKDYLHKDGSFIIWRSRRHGKFVITISHLRQLIYLRVQELPPRTRDGGPVYYLFENGFRTESILGLYQHYRQMGIQVPITSPQGRQHIEHIHLRMPLKVRLEKRRRR